MYTNFTLNVMTSSVLPNTIILLLPILDQSTGMLAVVGVVESQWKRGAHWNPWSDNFLNTLMCRATGSVLHMRFLQRKASILNFDYLIPQKLRQCLKRSVWFEFTRFWGYSWKTVLQTSLLGISYPIFETKSFCPYTLPTNQSIYFPVKE